jgi:hypothetical protein
MVDMCVTAIRSKYVFETTMKTLILYDEVDFARKAKTMLARAAHRADETIQWNVKPWRVHLLALTGIADAALTDAADAHLMVLEVRHQADLSPRLLDWLEKWATSRQIQGAALAVFDGGNGDTHAARAAAALSQLAGRHGLSFIWGDAQPAEEELAEFALDLREREVAQPSPLARILAQPVQGHYEHWGINE